MINKSIHLRALLIILLITNSAYSYIDPFGKGTSFSSQLEYVHPKEGPEAASVNTVDGKLDNLNPDLSKLLVTATITYQSIDRAYNAGLRPDGRFLVRTNRLAIREEVKDFLVLKNGEKCWAVRKIDNIFTPFEYTSISCDAAPVEETVAEIGYKHPTDSSRRLSIVGPGLLRSVFGENSLETQNFTFKDLDNQNLTATINEANLKFKVSVSPQNQPLRERDFINLPNGEGECFQVRLGRDGDRILFKRMKMRCDFDEIGGPVESRVGELAYIHPEKGPAQLSFTDSGKLRSVFENLPDEEDTFTFLDANNKITEAQADTARLKFNIRTNRLAAFKPINSIKIRNIMEQCYELSLAKSGRTFVFATKKISCDYKGIHDFFHISTLYSSTGDAIHRLQLGRLIGQKKLSGQGVVVGVIDQGFKIIGNPAIEAKMLPHPRPAGDLGNLIENALYRDGSAWGVHGSIQTAVLVGAPINKRIGIATSAQFMPVFYSGLGSGIKNAKDAQTQYGINIFSYSLQSRAFSDIYSNIDDPVNNMLFIAIAGNDKGANTKLANGYPAENDVLNHIIVTVAVDERGKLTKASSKCGVTQNICIAVPAVGPTSPTALTVAGVAALLKEAFPAATIEQIRTAILQGITPLSNPPDETGVGMLNAYRAYLRLQELLKF